MKNVILALLSLILMNCASSGKKNLARGNYLQSVLESAEKLRRSSDNKKASKVLKQALPLAQAQAFQELEDLNKSKDRFKNDGIVKSYRTLNILADEVARCPNCQKYVEKPQSYRSEEQSFKTLAADAHVVYGDEKMQNSANRNEARTAYENYEMAKDFVNDYPEINKKLNDAYFYATLKVVMEQAQINSKILPFLVKQCEKHPY